MSEELDTPKELMAAHVDSYHAFRKEQLSVMVGEHNRLVADVPQIKDTVE